MQSFEVTDFHVFQKVHLMMMNNVSFSKVFNFVAITKLKIQDLWTEA